MAHGEAQQSVRDLFGIHVPKQLETGLAEIPNASPRNRDTSEPLRILWAGRLRTWKGLPLLLRALHRLPPDVDFRLRVVGRGNRALSWQRLAERLGLSNRIEWIGWPAYQASLAHYAWADVFVFTSLRDTSGTGLLESLAFGLPIIGLDHQGAREIMTDACALRVPVQGVEMTIGAISEGIVRLSRDPRLLNEFSAAARARAMQFGWNELGGQMRRMYWQTIQATSANSTARSWRRFHPPVVSSDAS